MSEFAIDRIARRQSLCKHLKEMVVDRLDLPIDPDWITDDQALFGRGLELDSVDALELVSGLEYDLDVSIDDTDVGVFGSINSLADFVEKNTSDPNFKAPA
jgi:acyl carrier protein